MEILHGFFIPRNFCIFTLFMFSKYKYHILLHFVIFIWGFTGILGKLIHLDALSIVWYRVLIAFLGLAVAFLFLKKSVKITSKMTLLKIVGVGVLVVSHWITFYISIQLSTASLGIICLSTTTLHVTWLEPLIMKRPFSWLEFSLGLLIIYGIYVVSGDFNPNDYVALRFGLCSALFAALFSVFNNQLVTEVPAYKITFYELATALLVLTGVLLVQGKIDAHFFVMRWSDFLWLLFLGLVCTSFAFLATIEVMKRLGAFTVSLSINMEPVYTIILAIFILKENQVLGGKFYLGAVFIVCIVLANPLLKRWIKREH